MRVRLVLGSLLSVGLMLGCGGGGPSNQPIPKGNLTIMFGSDSFPGYTQAVVSLEKVEGSADGSNWIALGSVQKTFDLMALQNGNSVVMLPSAAVTPATYNHFRVTWATVNYQSAINQPAYVVPLGGNGQILTMPTTTVVDGSVTVQNNENATALIMLSGQQAIQLRPVGTSEAYTFQAMGNAYDLSGTAKITGKLADGSTPLAGVEVFAETVTGTGLATIQRRAFSDASGTYTLEGLQVGSPYFVVAQPAGTVSAYSAIAAAPVNATGASVYTANLAFSNPQDPGSLTLTITPASTATQSTWGELRQTLFTPIGSSASQTLIIQSQTLATNLNLDQAGFLGLAPGYYGVTAQRSTGLAAPIMKSGNTQVQVSSGGTASAALSYP